MTVRDAIEFGRVLQSAPEPTRENLRRHWAWFERVRKLSCECGTCRPEHGVRLGRALK